MANEVVSLRKSLKRQAKQAAETALRDGDVPPERLEALRRLQSLIEIAEAESSSWGARWLAAVALFGSLALASVLLIVHLPAAEIELDTVVSELSFAVESAAPLTPGMNVSDIRVSGPQMVELPDISPAASPQLASPAPLNRMRLSLHNSASGNITLSSFVVPKKTRVWLETADAPNHYSIGLQTPPDAPSAVQLSCQGEIGFAAFGTAAAKALYRFDVPQAFTSQLAPGQEISLDLSLPNGGEIILNPQLAISHLQFQHVERNLKRAAPRYLSTIISGALFNESLNGIKRNLRSGEALRFASSTGEMNRLSMRRGVIHAQFHGNVEGMTMGSETAPVNLMPSLLEWLRARHGLSLMWGTGFYFFGLLGGAWRWLRGAR